MKEKVFYSLIQKDDMIKAVKQAGFQFQKRGTVLYIYQNENGVCNIIDPLTGVSIYGEFFDIEDIDLFFTDDKIDSFLKERQTEKYSILRKIFAVYKRAAKLENEYKQMVKKSAPFINV